MSAIGELVVNVGVALAKDNMDPLSSKLSDDCLCMSPLHRVAGDDALSVLMLKNNVV